MKKRTLFLVIAALTLFTSCDKTASTAKIDQPTPTVTEKSVLPTVTPQKESLTKSTAIISNTATYSIDILNYKQGDINIQYPQINGLGDGAKEKIINELIKNEILNSYLVQSDRYKLSDLSTDIKCELTMTTDNIFSAMYTGTSYVKGGMHPNNEFNSITIDLKNAVKLYITDFTSIDLELVKKIKQSTVVTNNAVKKGMKKSSLIEIINAQDDQSILEDLQYFSKSDMFYIKPDSLGICIITGIPHAAGGYALVEIPGQYWNK